LRSAPSLQNSFVSPLNREITMDAMLGRLADFDVYKDQNVTKFTAGTHTAGGNITVKNAVSSGSSIVATGLTPGATFVAGDVISIDGTYEYNNVTRKSTNRNMQFVVMAGATANGSGDATLSVYPSLQFTGPRKNIVADGGDNDIPAGAVITVVGNHTPNFCYTERGLITCLPPLTPMDAPESSVATDSQAGISLRVSKTADVLNNKNILRIDGQMADAWVPTQAVRLISAV
jgi:hypothetical protein